MSSIWRLALFTIILPWLAPPAIEAQAPTTLSYQGRLLQNTADQDAVGGSIDIVFSIWTGPAGDGSATPIWSETWSGVALSNGIFTVLLGSNGSPLDPADFQTDTSLFLQLEVDGETLLPRQQFGSTPFAFVDQPGNELQDLSLDGGRLALSGSDVTVDLNTYLDNTDSQALALTGNTLSLSGSGSTVNLDAYLDNTDAQTLTLTGDMLTLSGSGSTVDLSTVGAVATLEAGLNRLGKGRRVFITSTRHIGDLGGMSGADAICQSRAASAGLSGTFLPWLSDSTTSPSDRFTRLGVPFVTVDGTVVARDWQDLVSTMGSTSRTDFLRAPIDRSETGSTITGTVWTGTDTSGDPIPGKNCDDWSATSRANAQTGKSDSIDGEWTDSGIGPCYIFHHLICVSQTADYDRGLAIYFDDTTVDNQELSISGDQLRLSSDDGTDVVDLSRYLDDTDTTVDNQQLSLVGDQLRLSSDDGTDTVDLSKYLDDTDTTVDNQELSISGDQLRLSSDDGTDIVDLSKYLDDTDTTVDNQELSISGDQLRLSSDDGTDTVDLSVYRDNTDAQTLSLSDDTLSITGSGSSVDLGSYMSRDEVLVLLRSVINVSTRTVFVSSASYTGNLGGLQGADEKCQALADAAGLPGLFAAWLSTPDESPNSRFVHGYRPIVRVDGFKIADNYADLTDGTLDSPINMTEKRTIVADLTLVWTGTNQFGNLDSTTCDGWTTTSGTGNAGFTSKSDARWTNASRPACDGSNRIYCMQQ